MEPRPTSWLIKPFPMQCFCKCQTYPQLKKLQQNKTLITPPKTHNPSTFPKRNSPPPPKKKKGCAATRETFQQSHDCALSTATLTHHGHFLSTLDTQKISHSRSSPPGISNFPFLSENFPRMLDRDFLLRYKPNTETSMGKVSRKCFEIERWDEICWYVVSQVSFLSKYSS